jgi:hypothetical protein
MRETARKFDDGPKRSFASDTDVSVLQVAGPLHTNDALGISRGNMLIPR